VSTGHVRSRFQKNWTSLESTGRWVVASGRYHRSVRSVDFARLQDSFLRFLIYRVCGIYLTTAVPLLPLISFCPSPCCRQVTVTALPRQRRHLAHRATVVEPAAELRAPATHATAPSPASLSSAPPQPTAEPCRVPLVGQPRRRQACGSSTSSLPAAQASALALFPPW